MRRALLPLALGIAGIAALANLHAAPLDTDACAKLKVEREGLEQAGARNNMAKGPQWAKANLAPDKLEQIRRLLDVEGQLLFRCSGQRLIELPAGVEADPAAAAPSEDAAEGKDGATQPSKADAAPGSDKKAPVDKNAAAKAQPAAKAAPAKTAPAKAKAEDKTAKDAAKTAKDAAKTAPAQKNVPAKRPPDKAGDNGTGPPAKAAAAKPKARVDDAYKPPPSDPDNPFPKVPQ